MSTELAQRFRTEMESLRSTLFAVPAALADVPWREGGWTRKQIVGHLLDSAANNRQRFVRGAIDGTYTGPTYGQDAWVAAHGYADQTWETLLRWWQVEHEILTAVVERVPEGQYEARCMVDGEKPVTLRFLIEDYIDHQWWHMKQIGEGRGLGT